MLIEKRRIGKDPNKHWYDDNKKKKDKRTESLPTDAVVDDIKETSENR